MNPTPEQQHVDEIYEISDKAFVDGIELLQLIEVMQAQNEGGVNDRLSKAGAAGAATVVRNGMLSRIILFLAGAYAGSRPGDLHLHRAFDLLKNSDVRKELGLRGSSTSLDEAERQWLQCKGDHRLPLIKHFRDKFTANLSTPMNDVGLPRYEDMFGFARETIRVIDALACGTGARTETLWDWQPQFVLTAFASCLSIARASTAD